MRQLYLPAILPTTLHDKFGLHPVNWMDPKAKGTAAYYPHALISFFHWRSHQRIFTPDVHIFGDSGGYSIATVGAEIDPIEVMWWQIKNCSTGCILDVPPFILRESFGSVLGGSAATNWKEALRLTLLNTERAMPIYLDALDRGEDFRWWGVAHGETDSQLEEWHGRVSEIYPFDHPGEGWALKPHPSNNVVALARLLRFCSTVEIRNAHFLQMTGFPALFTLFALGPDHLDFASYDSTTPIIKGNKRITWSQKENGLRIIEISEVSREGETFARDFLRTCPCLSCEWMRIDLPDVKPELLSEYYKYRMCFHNVLIGLETYQLMEKFVQDNPLKALKQKLKHRFGPVMRAIGGIGEGLQEAQIPQGAPQDLLDMLK